MRKIKLAGALPVLLLLVFFVSSCGKKFDITEYQLSTVSVTPGYWENGGITRFPSVNVRVSGPEKQLWEVTVTPENGGTPYEESFETGASCNVVLEGITLSDTRREMGITIRVTHVGTDEVLTVNRQFKATLEGNFEPPKPQETIHVTGLAKVVGEESTAITLTDSYSATVDVMERYSGFLVLSYKTDPTEEGPVSCQITFPETEGNTPQLTISTEGITREDGRITLPFTSKEPGTGSFTITLKGKGAETVFTVSYIVMGRPYEATFTPRRFVFAKKYDAHGTVHVFGFREGEKCNVVLHWKEVETGTEGSTSYPDIEARTPLDVILWKAGEVNENSSYSFWAEVFIDGKESPVATTEAQTVRPFAIGLVWYDAKGEILAQSDKVRSWKSSSTCTLEVRTASWAPDSITHVSVIDITAERSYSCAEPAPETEGYYKFEFKHPQRGVHQFTVTLETTEGDFTFETEKTFIDVWTVSPYADGSSLYATLNGPLSSIKSDCNITFTLAGYALWDYTVAEIDDNGQHVNTPKQATKYIGSRSEGYTIEKGTANGGRLRLVSGQFKLAMRMLKGKCSGKPFSLTGLTASRWSGDSVVTYTPEDSKTIIDFIIKADDAFLNDFNELESDISKLKPTLESNEIYCF